MDSPFSKITLGILKILLFFWIISISAFACWISSVILENQVLIIPVVMLVVILATVIGVYFYVLITIPQQFTSAFDVIKDKVALNQYTGIEEFQEEIAELLIHFFRFPGLDIIGGKFEFQNSKPLLIDIPANFDINLSKKPREICWIWKTRKSKGLFVPIRLGQKELGHMVLFTKAWTLRIFPMIISDIENNFLDDQIFHMISYEKRV